MSISYKKDFVGLNFVKIDGELGLVDEETYFLKHISFLVGFSHHYDLY